MEEINGEFLMKGCAEDDPSRLDTPEQLVSLLSRVGFLPLFSNTIPGFSVEEHVIAEHWWTGEDSDPWEWRHFLSSHPEIAYGKFFGKKAGFIHKDWFPVFANYRRNGYDFDALYDDGLAPYKWKTAMDLFSLDDAMVGKVLPASEVANEGIKAELQMRTYLIIYEFRQKRNKKGEPYGWHLAQLATPETKWGYDYVASAYSADPMVSWEQIKNNLLSQYSGADEKEIWSLLGMRVLSHEPVKPAKTPKPTKEPKKKTILPFPYNLIKEIGGVTLPINDDQVAGLRHALTTLKDKEQEALRLRYEDGATWAEAGKQLGISGTRAQQLAARGIRKLQHPNRSVFFRNGLEATRAFRKSLSNDDFLTEALRKLPITEIGMTPRVTNALVRHGLDTVGQVYDMLTLRTEELMRIRNFGAGSMLELLSGLKEHGIDIEFVPVTDPGGENVMIARLKGTADD